MTAVQYLQTDPEDEVDNDEAQRLAVQMIEEVLLDPLRGSALLRAAAMLMAYLALHEEGPGIALQALLSEMSGNARLALETMIAAEAHGGPARPHQEGTV